MQQAETTGAADKFGFTPRVVAVPSGDDPLRIILDSINDGVFISDATTGTFMDVNEPGCAMFGYLPEEIIGADIGLLSTDVSPYTQAHALGRFEKACTGGAQLFELHCKAKDGRLLWAEVSLQCLMLEGTLVGLAILRDITQRKHALQRLQEQRDTAQSYLDVAGVMVLALNLDGSVELLNRRGCEMLGYENASQVVGKSWVDNFIPERFRADCTSTFRAMVSGDVASAEYYEGIVVTKTGEERIIFWHNSLITDENGHVVTALSSGQDITRQRSAEDQLHQKVRKQTALAEFSLKSIASENISDALTHAADLIRKTLNTEYCVIFEAGENHNTIQLISQAGLAHEATHFYKLSEHPDSDLAKVMLKTGTSVRFNDIAQEHRFNLNPIFKQAGLTSGLCVLAKDGGNADILVFVFSIRTREFTDGEEEFALTFGNMIRVLRERERGQIRLNERDNQLRESQKMEAVGQLTGGVAHDFNNILTVILGNAGLLAEKLSGDAQLHDMAALIENAAVRGAALTSQLLVHARRRPLEPKVIDANLLLVSMDSLLRHTLSEDIEVELVRGADLWEALIDPSLLEGALLNLAINGRDAMPDGGRLTITTANVEINQEYADQHTDVTPGAYVMISVSDAGCGIAAENLERVFDPFFTTKEMGQGTGLGLSMVYGFVKQSKGHIKIDSKVGRGTTVKMYLPRTDERNDEVGKPPLSSPELRGTEKVLVVEDDNLVRAHATKQLVSLGYEVLAVENGPKALEILRKTTDFDLLFTDVIMPGGMNGRQLAEAAIALQPSLKVLYTSGYIEDAVIHHSHLDLGIYLLNKPYRLRDLAHKVRTVLSERD